MYDQKSQVEAWRRFIATGEIDESVVRPESRVHGSAAERRA